MGEESLVDAQDAILAEVVETLGQEAVVVGDVVGAGGQFTAGADIDIAGVLIFAALGIVPGGDVDQAPVVDDLAVFIVVPCSLRRIVGLETGDLTVGYAYDDFDRVFQKATYTGDTVFTLETVTYLGSSSSTSNRIYTYQTQASYTDVSFTYTYDENGNIIQDLRTIAYTKIDSHSNINAGSYITSYKYDDLERLAIENNMLAGKSWMWTYDSAGNITSKKEYAIPPAR